MFITTIHSIDSLEKLKTHAVYYVNDEKALVFSSLEDYGFLLDSISKIKVI